MRASYSQVHDEDDLDTGARIKKGQAESLVYHHPVYSECRFPKYQPPLLTGEDVGRFLFE
jgi:hypothetical protein